MAISKVVYKSSSSATPVTWMDATTATAAAADIIAPKSAMLADGVVTTGTGSGGASVTVNDYLAGTWPSGDITITAATSLSKGQLTDNTAITSITSSTVLSLEAEALRYCTGITSVSFSNMTTVRQRALSNCTSLSSVSLPKVTKVGMDSTSSTDVYAFATTALASLCLPECVSCYGRYSFGGMGSSSNKVAIALPKLANSGTNTFRSSYWSAIDFGPNLTTIGSNDIYDTRSYNWILILRSSSVVTASASGAIRGVNGYTTIYIPESLYNHLGDGTASDYKAATGWSAKTSTTWAKIEGSIYETQYADGTTIPTT